MLVELVIRHAICQIALHGPLLELLLHENLLNMWRGFVGRIGNSTRDLPDRATMNRNLFSNCQDARRWPAAYKNRPERDLRGTWPGDKQARKTSAGCQAWSRSGCADCHPAFQPSSWHIHHRNNKGDRPTARRFQLQSMPQPTRARHRLIGWSDKHIEIPGFSIVFQIMAYDECIGINQIERTHKAQGHD